jgi:hypothetical protein
MQTDERLVITHSWMVTKKRVVPPQQGLNTALFSFFRPSRFHSSLILVSILKWKDMIALVENI